MKILKMKMIKINKQMIINQTKRNNKKNKKKKNNHKNKSTKMKMISRTYKGSVKDNSNNNRKKIDYE